MNFRGYDRPWEETWYNIRSREKNPKRNYQDKNLEGLIQASLDNDYATNAQANFLEHAAHSIFSFVPAPVKKAALTAGLLAAIAACGGQGFISTKAPVPSPSPASATLPVPERRIPPPITHAAPTPGGIYKSTQEATVASPTKTPEIKIDFEKLSKPAIIPQTTSNTYDVIFYFQEPKSNLQEYVFNNTDVVTYMKFVRAENDFEYKKAIGKFVIDIFHHNIPSAFVDVIDLYREALESSELNSFYISLETFRAFHESRPYNQTMVPAEPNNLQLTQSGEKKPIDELVMDFVSYSKWNADFLLQKKKYEEESGLKSQWNMHKGPDNSGYIGADINLPLEKAWDIEMDTSLGRPIILGDRIYIADDDNRLNVLSAATGEKDFGMHLRYTGATPAAIEDMVIASGFLSASEARGRYSNSALKAFDSDSGEEIWREYMLNPKTAIIDGDTVYVVDQEYQIQSRNIHDGSLYWDFNLEDALYIIGSPKITEDTIYFLGTEEFRKYHVYSLSENGNLRWKADATPDLNGHGHLVDHEFLYGGNGIPILLDNFLILENHIQRYKDDGNTVPKEYCFGAFNLETRSLELDDCLTKYPDTINSIVSDGKDLYVSYGNKILRYTIEDDEMKKMPVINLENTIFDSVLTNKYIFAATEAGITAIDRNNPDTRHKIHDFEYEKEIGGVNMAISGADLYVVAKPRGPEHIIKFSNPAAQQAVRNGVTIKYDKTDSNGIVTFKDSATDQTVTVEVADASSKPLHGMQVQYLDSKDFEGLIVEDPNNQYAPSFRIYPHITAPPITTFISTPSLYMPITMQTSGPEIREVNNSSPEGQAIDNLVEHAKNEWEYMGRRTPEQLDAENKLYSFIIGLAGIDTSVVSDVVGMISDISDSVSGWQEPEFYDVYEVIPANPITTTIRVLVPVQGELKPTPTTTLTLEERTLENISGGPLAETFPQLERSTIQHAYQMTTERRTNPELRDRWFYTADFALYTVEKEGSRDEIFLYLGRGEINPIFNNIEEATQQLIETRDYIPPQGDIEAVKSAESTLRVKLSDLKLLDYYGSGVFYIDTENYDRLNPEQRRVAEHVYGRGEDFEQNMEMLRQNRINNTGIYVLDPDYVKQNAPQDGALARVSRLGNFDSNSSFGANVGNVDVYDALRGVPNVAEGGAQKKIK